LVSESFLGWCFFTTNRLPQRRSETKLRHVQQKCAGRVWVEISCAQGFIYYWTSRIILGLSGCLASPWQVRPWAHEISTPKPCTWWGWVFLPSLSWVLGGIDICSHLFNDSRHQHVTCARTLWRNVLMLLQSKTVTN
jgi:hypothetical protein